MKTRRRTKLERRRRKRMAKLRAQQVALVLQGKAPMTLRAIYEAALADDYVVEEAKPQGRGWRRYRRSK